MTEDLLTALIDRSLRFEYLAGGVTPILQPHSTGWRTLPSLMIAQTRRGRTTLQLEGAPARPVPAEGLIVIPAGVHHQIELVTPTGQSDWVHVSYAVLDGLDLFALFEIEPLHGRKLGTRVGSLIAGFIGRSARPGEGVLARAAARNEFGFRLLGELAPHLTARAGAHGRIEALQSVRGLLDFVHRNLHEPIDRERMCGIVSMSQASLHRAFTAGVGCSPLAYVRRARLHHAQRLLIATGLAVGEIAARVGYDDAFVFSRFFKRASGHSPSEYRARARAAGV